MLLLVNASLGHARDDGCPGQSGVTVQVLGSGGPIADDGRASSGYLVWMDGRARVLVDAGGGVFLRFGQSGARFEDLELVALSHYHTDHSADLPALLKSGFFSPRERDLAVSGPAGNHAFPGLSPFLDGLIGAQHGAYRYLSGYRNGTDGLVRLSPIEIALDQGVQAVTDTGTVQVSAQSVPHGIVPTVAYRIQLAGKRLVFASDQNADDPSFADFARGADLLVMHLAIPEAAGAAARSLHATPGEIGRLAARAEARRLLLSHFMARSLADLEMSLEAIRKRFKGPLDTASDLACYKP